jgi:predicted MFS family arabinose efflux permease
VIDGRLLRLIAAKTVANLGIRWVPFFLPVLAVAFSATTRQMTAVLGLAELTGLATLAVGRHLDRGRELVVSVTASALVAVGCLLALSGRFELFAVGMVVIFLGVNFCTVSGHTYLSRRVGFAQRGRAIGLFETSWALSLLVGAPIVAALITRFGWPAPFVAIAGAAMVTGALVATSRSEATVLADARPGPAPTRLTGDAWTAIAASGAIAVMGLTTIAVVGTWLNDRLGVATGGVGLVAMAFGAAELAASGSSAALADRLGPNRATRGAVVLAAVGLAVMVQAGSSLPIGALGLALFFLGFEFSIVTSFTIVSEAVPTARGRALAANTAVGTTLRGIGVALSGTLYETFGISGPVAISAAGAVGASLLLTVVHRRDRPG